MLFLLWLFIMYDLNYEINGDCYVYPSQIFLSLWAKVLCHFYNLISAKPYSLVINYKGNNNCLAFCQGKVQYESIFHTHLLIDLLLNIIHQGQTSWYIKGGQT